MAKVYQKTIKNPSFNKANQDRILVWYPNDINKTLKTCGVYGIFDGHGSLYDLGGFSAETLKKFMEENLEKYWNLLQENPKATIEKIFLDANKYLFQQQMDFLDKKGNDVKVVDCIINNTNYPSIKYKKKLRRHALWKKVHGGSTGSMLFILENDLVFLAHLGDSDAYFMNQEKIIPLYQDHSPTSISEYKRILDELGEDVCYMKYDLSNTSSKRDCLDVFSKIDDEIVLNDAKVLYKEGKYVYHKNVEGDWASLFINSDYNDALAFTRSFGDFNLSAHGLSFIPDIIQLDKAPGVIVLGSDGVWDNWKRTNFWKKYVEACENLKE